MTQSKNTQLTVNNFEGDPTLVDFFFDQIKSLASIYKWSPEFTVTFLRGKLVGPALQFFIQSEDLYKSNNIDFIQKEFKEFFAPQSQTSASVELNNLVILPQETIKHFAHRLNRLVSLVYTDIQDVKSLESVKLHKFISTIPPNLRIKLQEEQINYYKKAVDRAQTLQDIALNETLLNQMMQNPTVNKISQQLVELTEKVNSLSFTNNTQGDSSTNKNKDVEERGSNSFSPRCFKNHYKTKFPYRSKPNKNRFHPRTAIICQLCNRKGHTANRCFKWQHLNTQQNKHISNDGNKKN